MPSCGRFTYWKAGWAPGQFCRGMEIKKSLTSTEIRARTVLFLSEERKLEASHVILSLNTVFAS